MNGLDVDAYLARIGLERAPGPTADGLWELHEAHLGRIPFENLSIQTGELPIRLDVPSLVAKMVRRRRGGYCFEQNTLFLAALSSLGLEAIACEARVRPAPGVLLPRTHMTLLVRLPRGGGELLCDVGFGGDGPLHPLPTDGSAQEQPGGTYRVASEGGLLVLQVRREGAWQDLYAFLPEERPAVDFEVGNWWTSTHPASRFVVSLTAQRSTRTERRILRNLLYEVVKRRGETSRELEPDEVIPILRSDFDLDVPDGATFRALPPAPS